MPTFGWLIWWVVCLLTQSSGEVLVDDRWRITRKISKNNTIGWYIVSIGRTVTQTACGWLWANCSARRRRSPLTSSWSDARYRCRLLGRRVLWRPFPAIACRRLCRRRRRVDHLSGDRVPGCCWPVAAPTASTAADSTRRRPDPTGCWCPSARSCWRRTAIQWTTGGRRRPTVVADTGSNWNKAGTSLANSSWLAPYRLGLARSVAPLSGSL